MDAIAKLHAQMPRQGPGCAADVQWAVSLLGLSGALSVVDAGCGPGADLVALCDALPQAQITGIESFPHLAEEARARVAGRAQVVTGDMSQIDGPVDFIWCAGALYFLGVTQGLSGWQPALVPGGTVCFSEPVLPDGPRDVAERFWHEYPAITDRAGLTARIEKAGFTLLDTRDVVGDAWGAEYLAHLETRIALLRPEADGALSDVLDAAQTEIDTWKQAPEQIIYQLCLVQPA